MWSVSIFGSVKTDPDMLLCALEIFILLNSHMRKDNIEAHELYGERLRLLTSVRNPHTSTHAYIFILKRIQNELYNKRSSH